MRKLKGLAYFILGWGGIIATVAAAPQINIFFAMLGRNPGIYGPPITILPLLALFGIIAVKSLKMMLDKEKEKENTDVQLQKQK